MSNSLVREAVRTALVIGVVSTLATGPNVLAQQEGSAELERLVVTGSRINRLDVEAARPLTIISREDIERSGQPTVSDVLRSLPYNSFGAYREISGNTFAGQSLIDLKGLGVERTLILLNGRRMPRSPVTADQAIDLNTLPLEAVERIEVLTDSASAVYGSDAIGGVINIILRDDFEGLQFRANVGRPSQNGADRQGVSFVIGNTSDSGNFVVAAESYKKDMIFSRDRAFTAPDFGDGVNLGTTEGINKFGNTLLDFAGNGTGGPERGDPNCDAVVDSNGNPLFAGIYNDGPNESCAYAHAAVSGQTQDIDRNSLFINAEYELTPDTTAIYTGVYSRVEAFGRNAAAAGLFCIDLDIVPNLDPAWQDLQGTDSINCDDVTPTIDAALAHRFVGLGPRDDYDTNSMFDNQITFEGVVGQAEWDLWAGKTVYTGQSRGFNYVRTSVVESLVASLEYNPLDPLNPANEDAYGQMRHTTSRDIETDFLRVGGSLGFDAGELPAGPIGWSVGFEYNDQTFQDLYDPAREARDVLGSAGNSTTGERSNYAVFGEALLPLTETLELSVAVRHDSYDDSSGSETTPHLALSYRPNENWLFRGSWGEGFRAPNMLNLYGTLSFSSEPASDLVFCEDNNIDPCADGAVDTFSGGNPSLKPETSESFNLGVVWTNDRMSVSADYWNVDITEALTLPTAQELINLELRGIPLPAGASITRDASGAISDCLPGQTLGCGILRPWLNLSRQDHTGLDLRFDYNLPLSGSEMNFRVIHSHMLEALEQTSPIVAAEDRAGKQDKPEFRSIFITDWSRGDHTVSLIRNQIDGYVNANNDKISSMTTWDAQWGWNFSTRSQLFLGVHNITDEDPPLDPTNDTVQPFNSEIYGFDGRVTYLSYQVNF